jgi:hypothetical protein
MMETGFKEMYRLAANAKHIAYMILSTTKHMPGSGSLAEFSKYSTA